MAEAKQLTRRSFLATTALAAGAFAAGCASEEPRDESIVNLSPADATAEVEEQTFINYCRGNCAERCQIQATVRDGKIVKTIPLALPKEAEGLQQGCVRGNTNVIRIYATNRLLYPMKQTGERGSDNWERISWDEALDIVANKFQAAIDEYGPASTAFWTGCGNNALALTGAGWWKNPNTPRQRNRTFGHGLGFNLMRQKLGSTVIETNADAAMTFMVTEKLCQPSNSNEDLVHSKTIFIWGENPVESNRHQWFWIAKAKEAGATLVTIDPRYSKIAAESDVWVPIRPGTDGALILAMCNYIIEHDYIDYDYLCNHSVASFLIKDDNTYLRLSDLGMELDEVEDKEEPVDSPVVWDTTTSAPVSSLTSTNAAHTGITEVNGIPVKTVYDATVETIREFTVEYAAKECDISEEQIQQLAEMYVHEGPSYINTGLGIDRFANAWRIYYGFGLLAALTGNACKLGANYSLSGSASSYLTCAPKLNQEMFALEDAKDNIYFTENYLAEVVETGKWAGQDINLQCVYIICANPLHSSQGVMEMKEAMRKIPFVVCADSFMTDTAKEADLVLPVPLTWETQDFMCDGVATYMARKAIEPAGECRTDMEIFRGLAEKMGFDDLYTMTDEEYLREIIDTPENIEAGYSYDAFVEHGLLNNEYKYGERVGQEYNQFGRTQFYLEELQPRDDFGQQWEFHDHLPYYEHAYEGYPGNPLAEKYPYFAMSAHEHFHAQSSWGHNPWLNELRKDPEVRIHPDIAAEHDIATGDVVRVYNDRGSVTLKALVTPGLRPDIVYLPHGYYGDEYIDGHPQTLIPNAPDYMTSNGSCNDVLCQIERV